jgi:hypothetical protein
MFAKITNGAVDKFPYSVGQLRHDNPNTSFPKQVSDELLAEFGVVAVTEKPAPDFNPLTHFAEWGPVPILEEGTWVVLPNVREYSEDQIAERDAATATSIRSQRDCLLPETDWTGLTDVVMSPEMAAYRQALRDITEQVGFPNTVVWPVKP